MNPPRRVRNESLPEDTPHFGRGENHAGSRCLAFRLPLIHPVPVQSIFAVLALFLLAALLLFFALFAAVAHRVPLTQFKRARAPPYPPSFIFVFHKILADYIGDV